MDRCQVARRIFDARPVDLVVLLVDAERHFFDALGAVLGPELKHVEVSFDAFRRRLEVALQIADAEQERERHGGRKSALERRLENLLIFRLIKIETLAEK